jgi:hypothetical protein
MRLAASDSTVGRVVESVAPEFKVADYSLRLPCRPQYLPWAMHDPASRKIN